MRGMCEGVVIVLSLRLLCRFEFSSNCTSFEVLFKILGVIIMGAKELLRAQSRFLSPS